MITSTHPFYSSNGLCTDSRNLIPGNLFLCIKGENYDGNEFASQALIQGAEHVIVDNEEFYLDNGNMTLVENSVDHLQALANFHRKQFDIPVIGITGSNGKTTTKELLHAVLDRKYNVLATEGNLNNHLGVPFTLLRLNKEHEIAIIEMGANHQGEIGELCLITEPTHGIITNIGKAHLEGFNNLEGVIKTKKELYDSLEKSRGTIFSNGLDEILSKILPDNTTNIIYSSNDTEIKSTGDYLSFSWTIDSYTSPVLESHLIGIYNINNFLAAITVGYHFEVNNEDINSAIEEYVPSNNRSQIKETNRNKLILDCYNANPTSMKLALESLEANPSPNKVFVIGDMRELGSESSYEHQKIVELAEKLNLRGFLVGEEFHNHDSQVIIEKFKSADDASEYFKKNEIKNQLILLKASRGIKLEVLEEVL
jgi:UDP-N-acetylmuramoyl-tripeptide--D-alanyl-D-alanine ligase